MLLLLMTAFMVRTVLYDAMLTTGFFGDDQPDSSFCNRMCFFCSSTATYEYPDVHDNEEDPESLPDEIVFDEKPHK